MPKIVDHEQYRKQLLASCAALFAKHGYAGVSMKQVAQAAGVTTGTLYHYFADKEALFAALVQEMNDRDLERVTAQASGRENREEMDGSVAEQVADAFRTLTPHTDQLLSNLLILIDYAKQHGAPAAERIPAVRAANTEVRNAVAATMHIEDPRIVTLFCAIMDGLMVEHYLGQPYATFEEQASLLGEIFAAYFAAKYGVS